MTPVRFFALQMTLGVFLAVIGKADAQTTELYVTVQHRERIESLDNLPVMVSAIRDGKVVRQHEVLLVSTIYSPVRWGGGQLSPGLYDVRAEGDGVITEVKRGIHVVPDAVTTVGFVMRPGEGAHIVEYAEGGLSREEIAARLARIESELARLTGN